MTRDAPLVGIFWGVPAPGGIVLATETTPLAQAEPYDDRLTHATGHAETWAAWRALVAGGLARRGLPAAIAWHQYNELPRGRVVADTHHGGMFVYADPALLGATLRERLRAAFALPASVGWWTDPHYRTGRSMLP